VLLPSWQQVLQAVAAWLQQLPEPLLACAVLAAAAFLVALAASKQATAAVVQHPHALAGCWLHLAAKLMHMG
jgi:hypothetical protein